MMTTIDKKDAATIPAGLRIGAAVLPGLRSATHQNDVPLFRERGWTAVPHIGPSRFRIDPGIVDPEQPGACLAGVASDGASRDRVATACDRGKGREAVLAGLGWALVRVWSTDCWHDTPAAHDRPDDALLARARTTRGAPATRVLDDAHDRASEGSAR